MPIRSMTASGPGRIGEAPAPRQQKTPAKPAGESAAAESGA
jgi:hypothetical protein